MRLRIIERTKGLSYELSPQYGLERFYTPWWFFWQKPRWRQIPACYDGWDGTPCWWGHKQHVDSRVNSLMYNNTDWKYNKHNEVNN